METTLSAWREVWERKGREGLAHGGTDIASLLRADGYDSQTGQIDGSAFCRWAAEVAERVGLKDGYQVLEVGCGAGAFLTALSSARSVSLAGVDYSESLLRLARRALPTADVRLAEAAELPFADDSFDRVFSQGVLYYFPDLGYARDALSEMARVLKPAGRVFLGDLPDLAKKEECEAARNAAALAEDKEYLTALVTTHLYYPVSFVEEFSAEHGFGVQIYQQNIGGYANAPFRFNVILTRTG